MKINYPDVYPIVLTVTPFDGISWHEKGHVYNTRQTICALRRTKKYERDSKKLVHQMSCWYHTPPLCKGIMSCKPLQRQYIQIQDRIAIELTYNRVFANEFN
jgi:hypothetical protein